MQFSLLPAHRGELSKSLEALSLPRSLDHDEKDIASSSKAAYSFFLRNKQTERVKVFAILAAKGRLSTLLFRSPIQLYRPVRDGYYISGADIAQDSTFQSTELSSMRVASKTLSSTNRIARAD